MVIQVRKLPVIMEAVQVTGTQENLDFLWVWSNKQVWTEHGVLKIKCLEAIAESPIGTYVVKGIKGEVWPVREDIFNETYEILKR